jgi:hypothetical protein
LPRPAGQVCAHSDIRDLHVSQSIGVTPLDGRGGSFAGSCNAQNRAH